MYKLNLSSFLLLSANLIDTFSLPTIGNPSRAVLLLIVFPVSAKVTFAVMVSSKILSKYSNLIITPTIPVDSQPLFAKISNCLILYSYAFFDTIWFDI